MQGKQLFSRLRLKQSDADNSHVSPITRTALALTILATAPTFALATPAHAAINPCGTTGVYSNNSQCLYLTPGSDTFTVRVRGPAVHLHPDRFPG